MAKKKTKVMDGFAVVRGLAKAQQEGNLPLPGSRRPSGEVLPSAPPPVATPEQSRQIVKTVSPTKRTIRCFEGAAMSSSWRARRTAFTARSAARKLTWATM